MTATVLFTKSQYCNSPSPAARPLVVLHGLFGNWENWGARIRQYQAHTDVHAMDLRNHGESPHLASMNYSEMAEDVVMTLEHLDIERCDLLGHSMGGKVAMRIAATHAEKIARLILVDIAPKDYPAHHQEIIDALCAIDPLQLDSRREADQQLAEAVDDASVRAFLLKNLVRKPGASSVSPSGFHWQFNLDALKKNYPELMLAPEIDNAFEGETLFIKGAESDYLQDSDTAVVRQAFPNAQLKILAGAGHWPHAEKPEMFDHVLKRFLEYT